MADQSDSVGKGGGGAARRGGSGGGASASGGGSGGGGNRNRNRNRNRSSRNRSQPAGSGSETPAAQAKGQGGGGQRSPSSGGNRSRSRSVRGLAAGSRAPRSRWQPPPPPPPLEPLDVRPGVGAPQILPGEVAANRRRAVRLCAWTAVIPAVLFGALLWVSVSLIAGIVAFVVAGAAVMYAVWRLAPTLALRRIGAVPIDEHDDPRLSNVTEGLCATFGLCMPSLHVVDDDVPNACALGRDARRSDLVVTSGLLRSVDPIELEGVIAHELAHVKRGDNGVSCIGITLGHPVRRRVDAAALRRGEPGVSGRRRGRVGGALSPRPARRAPHDDGGPCSGRALALRLSLSVRVDPLGLDRPVGGPPRTTPLVPGDLDATSVRAAALSEW